MPEAECVKLLSLWDHVLTNLQGLIACWAGDIRHHLQQLLARMHQSGLWHLHPPGQGWYQDTP